MNDSERGAEPQGIIARIRFLGDGQIMPVVVAIVPPTNSGRLPEDRRLVVDVAEVTADSEPSEWEWKPAEVVEA